MSPFIRYILSSLFSTLIFSSLFSYFIMQLISFYILGKDNRKGLLKKIFKNKDMLCLFLFIFFTFSVFYLAVIQRECVYSPLSNVFGGWSPYNNETNSIDYQMIGNIFLLIPSSILFSILTFDEYFVLKPLLKTVLASFLFSLFIELCQLIFSKGTFQFSDIVYNTLGGLIGALIYLLAKLIINKIKEKGTK